MADKTENEHRIPPSLNRTPLDRIFHPVFRLPIVLVLMINLLIVRGPSRADLSSSYCNVHRSGPN